MRAPGVSGCDPGYRLDFYIEGARCDPCYAGTSSPGGDQRYCDTCPAGDSSADTAAACTPCPAGSVSQAGGLCTLCLPTTFSAAGAAACTLCPAGTSNPLMISQNGTISGFGASSCPACPAGQTSVAGGNCFNCSAGSISAAGEPACTACPAGTSSAGGAPSCTACPAGQTSVAGGACFACSPFALLPNGDFSQGVDGSPNIPCARAASRAWQGHVAWVALPWCTAVARPQPAPVFTVKTALD